MASIDDRLAGAPISWGACEVPGWGIMPSVDRVLAEMAELGLKGTELGAPGFFPDDPERIDELLTRNGLELVGGFVALVLHEPDLIGTIDEARRAASLIAGAGGEMFVVGVVQDMEWSRPRELDDDGWARLAHNLSEIDAVVADQGLTLALHPHAGTLIETSEQVERAIEAVDVGWCLDTGHLTIGGVDPVEFARSHGDRVVHLHLKDVDAEIAADFRAGRRSLVEATRNGLFLPLGKGDARVAEVMGALQAHGYDRWLVLEQDTAITGDEPTVAGGPMRDARESIAFLHHTARTTEEINQ
ncbi:MAG TPA: sugar phosphate isomerase/epimerase [Solirubrobacteraceae bacterium]|jgi:inosose dehydratase|nr:sugar phosphate isomerase/epimerase [Solirubrobacteraceae bacterium]